MDDNISAPVDSDQPSFWLRSSNRQIRTVIFEYALIAAILGLNPLPNLFSLSLILLGCLSFKMMRDIGSKWGYPKGQDILAIAGNLFGGLGALIMACLTWSFIIVITIYFPILKILSLTVAYATFTWIVGQATNQYYATGKASEIKDEHLVSRSVGIANEIGGGGGSLKRRRVLLGTLAIGTTMTGLSSYLKQRELTLAQAQLSQLARESHAYVEQYLQQAFMGDTVSAQQIQAIKNSTKLVSPTLPYDRTISKLLIRCTRLGTEQYLTGTIVPNYDGSITTLPSFAANMAKYTQVATLIGPEEATTTRKLELSADETATALLPRDRLREDLNQVEDRVKAIGGEAITLKWLNPVYWGFILQSPDHSIIAFRGTQRTNEWIDNILVQQVNHTALSPFEFVGNIHRGFSAIYGTIAQQVLVAAEELDHSRPIYITGHSLGASLATLAAMDLAIRMPKLKHQLRLYTYAGPRVGDVKFAEAHSHLVPNHYRIVNLADGIPTAPPTITGKLVFAHAGQLWAFVDYSGDLILGHFISVYKKAINAEQESLMKRQT
ncbi:lipase family protein [Pantanalinema rosaneae CENA516]|uniref:lipase family protein n=1 Tax=Pantanalinema rosaneae TaxID=1620701 RepID=UPI003D6F5BBC